ncbi:30S ribosomal protein S15 [Buchnera aphidicola]|uniref:30S ribosomal protein S15 n=1 Tax=Buchnera aphidicola TaxID=9 RepID=UPI003464E1E9
MKAFNRKDIILKYGQYVENSGISSVQIALLSYKINYLKQHFDTHKHDFSSKRGLLRMVSRRRKLLDYLKTKNLPQYNILIQDLGLRR